MACGSEVTHPWSKLIKNVLFHVYQKTITCAMNYIRSRYKVIYEDALNLLMELLVLDYMQIRTFMCVYVCVSGNELNF